MLGTNLHNKICKFWVSGWQIVFHLGNIRFITAKLVFEYQRGCCCPITRGASMAGVRVDCTGAGAADLGNKKENTAAEAVLIVISEVRGLLIIRGHRQDIFFKGWGKEVAWGTSCEHLRAKKKRKQRISGGCSVGRARRRLVGVWRAACCVGLEPQSPEHSADSWSTVYCNLRSQLTRNQEEEEEWQLWAITGPQYIVENIMNLFMPEKKPQVKWLAVEGNKLTWGLGELTLFSPQSKQSSD